MNLPNKLTLLRICMVPMVVVFLLVDSIPFRFLIADILFIIASLTDYLDGKIARKHQLVTDFGKFADPLADKALVFSVLLCLVDQKIAGGFVVMVLLLREFMVMAVRLSAAKGGKVVAASFWAKAKTASQMIAIVLILALVELANLQLPALSFLTGEVVRLVSEILLWISAVFSVVSGIEYMKNNWEFISQTK